ncbi:MAG: hypothetical protein ABI655_04335 [Phenylobacterium sp.]
MRLLSAIAMALVLTSCASRAPAPEQIAAAVDPQHARLDPSICRPGRASRNPEREKAEVTQATRPLEAQSRAQMLVTGGGAADESSEAAEKALANREHAYHRARFAKLYPLAARGNANAIYQLSKQYGGGESGFNDEAESLRLQRCASDLGEPQAEVEMMRWHWHQKGDGAFATIQRNRSVALDLAARAAEAGNLGGVASLGVYIGDGFHQYPESPSLGRRLLTLCARAADDFCRSELVKAAKFGRRYALEDPVDTYLLLEALAATQPALYGTTRDSFAASLSPAQLQSAQRKASAWEPTSWEALKPLWLEVRRDILANGCPSSVSCRIAHLCVCPAP